MRYIDLINEILESDQSLSKRFVAIKDILDEGIRYGDTQCFALKEEVFNSKIPEDFFFERLKKHLEKESDENIFNRFLGIIRGNPNSNEIDVFLTKNKLEKNPISIYIFCLSKAMHYEYASVKVCTIISDVKVEACIEMLKYKVKYMINEPPIGIDGLSFKNYLRRLSDTVYLSYVLNEIRKHNIKLSKDTLTSLNHKNNQFSLLKDFYKNPLYDDLFNQTSSILNSFFNSIRKKLFKDEYVYDEKLINESFEILATFYQFITKILNKIQNQLLKEDVELNHRLTKFLQKNRL